MYVYFFLLLLGGGLLCFRVTRRYRRLSRLSFSSCGGLRPSSAAFFFLWAKKGFLCHFSLFWYSVVTSLTLGSNLCNFDFFLLFKKKSNNLQKKIHKKVPKILNKFQSNPKNPLKKTEKWKFVNKMSTK